MQCYLDGGDYKAAMQVFEKIPTVRNNIIINNSVLLLLKVLNTFTLYFTFYFGLNFNLNFSLDSILILILIFLFLLLLIFYVILYLKSSYIYNLQNRQMFQLPYIIINLEIQLREIFLIFFFAFPYTVGW